MPARNLELERHTRPASRCYLPRPRARDPCQRPVAARACRHPGRHTPTGCGAGHRQWHRCRRKPAHRGGYHPLLHAAPAGRPLRFGAAGPLAPHPLRHRPVPGRPGRAPGRPHRGAGAGEPDRQPGGLRGQPQDLRRPVAAPGLHPSAGGLHAPGGPDRPGEDPGALCPPRPLRRHGGAQGHRAAAEPGRCGLRDQGERDRADRPDQLRRQRGLLGQPAEGDRGQPRGRLVPPLQLLGLLRSGPAELRPRAAAPLLPPPRLCRRAGDGRDGRAGAGPFRLLRHLYGQRGEALPRLQDRPDLGAAQHQAGAAPPGDQPFPRRLV